MKKIIFIIIILITSLFLYGKYIEVNNLKLKEYNLKNENIPDSFKELKIIHFSDILYNNDTKMLDKLKKEINNNTPDVIVFSGDLFNQEIKYSEEDYNNLQTFLTEIEANLYKFAVIGDNDKIHLDKYKDILYEADFIRLDNQNKLLFYKDNNPINIIGLTNLENISELLITDVEYKYSLAIIHEPDNFEELAKYNINAILSGHSLGGVINIPYTGGIIKKTGAKKYINDYYKLNNIEIFISNGIGNEKYNFRLFNTPSINIYKFSNN